MTYKNIPLGKLAAKIQALANVAVTEIYSEFSRDLPKFIRYIKKEPVTKACCELKALRAASLLGQFVHEDEKIQNFVRDNLDDINFMKIVGQLSSAMPLGFSCAEIEFGLDWNGKGKKTIIKGIDVLDHKRISFRGNKGSIIEMTYVDITKKYIPYTKIIHLTNGLITDFDEAFGTPEIFAALPYITAKLSILNNMVVAGKNNATGIWIGKTTDRPIKIYDKDGKEQPKTSRSSVHLADQLSNLQNFSYLVTDIENDIMPTQIGDGSQFWIPALQYLDKMIMRSFNVPDLVFSEGTGILSKTATLAGKHLSVMDNTIKAMTQQLKFELIEKAIKPVIWANFGHQNSWGDFVVSKELDETQEATQLQNLMSAISYGILAGDDPDVQNQIRKMLSLPTKSKDEIEKQKMEQAQLQAQIAQLQAMGQPQMAGEQYP